MASKVITGIKTAAEEPLLTGALLYALTRGPDNVRARLLAPFQNNVFAKNGAARLAAFITVLKILTGVNVLKRVNRVLNSLAWNNWSLGRRPGAAFKFGPNKEELVIITGGSSGFGYEMVKAFSKLARVVVLDIQDFPLELASLPDVHFYKCDITDTPIVESRCKEIRETHGEATVLVNNAGIGIGKTVLETSNSECERLFKVNLISHFVLIREFLPGMLKKRKGHIVTIASMASFVAAPGLLDYCCSKVAALYVSEGIRNECLSRYAGGEGICTTSVHPSWHATAIIKGAEKTLNKYGIHPDPPSNVGDVVVEQVLKGRSGRLVVPKSEEGKTGLRNWPRWVQDLLFGNVFRSKDRFEFGKEDTKLIA
ncbi:NAD(P)-binding protein [Eremomyces bilateralis CBS 781.70]|uniref:NAD(P)-binding protein n=1 Tax=Eremomyces bilateralis CBS 781.70 TaxID=1392243 RepID=A0A6G1FUT9_9PEZI|nr:NAD(P)-binding protein [Eremomyces bilateralis CBS 781.70]KAF1809544.1 NAD(P)-binding protein [Eremomyces bilateralis CBS 781.70]